MAMSDSTRPRRSTMKGLWLPLAAIFGILAMFVIGWAKSWQPDEKVALPSNPPVPSTAPLPR